MIKYWKPAVVAGLLIPSAAFAQINVGDQLGTSEDAIRAALQTKGYAVTEIEFEDDEIEVNVTADGKSLEFEISPETGLVLAIEDEADDD